MTTFILTVTSDCVITVIEDQQVDDMVAYVNQAAYLQSLVFPDSISESHGISGYCGARTYTIVPNYPFLSVIVGSNFLSLVSTDISEVGNYPVTLIVSLTSFPLVAPLIKTFNAMIYCQVLTITPTIVPAPEVSLRIMVDGPFSTTFGFQAFPACSIIYELVPSYPFAQLDSFASLITVTSSNLGDQGEYTLKIVAREDVVGGVSSTQTIKVNLINLCNEAMMESQTLLSLEVIKQSQEYYIPAVIRFKEFNYFPKSQYDTLECGRMEYTLQQASGPAPPWVELDSKNNEIIVSFFKISKSIVVSLTLIARLSDYPTVTAYSSFKVILSEAEIKCQPNPQIVYNLGASALKFSLTFWNSTTVEQLKLTPVSQPVAFINGSAEGNLPKFIEFNQVSQLFKVESNDYETLGDYEVGLKMGYVEFPQSIVTCRKKLTINYVPEFKGGGITDQTLIIGKQWKLNLPMYQDFFGEFASIAVDLGTAIEFVRFDASKGTPSLGLSVDPAELESYKGIFPVVLTLTDKAGASMTIKFNINVIELEKPVEVSEPKQFTMPPPRPYIMQHNQIGKMKVGFTRPILPPTYDRYPEFTLPENMSSNCTNGGKCKPVRELQMTFEEETRQATEIVNYGQVKMYNKSEPIVQLSIIPGEESDSSLLNFKWNCTNFTSTFMDFELFYEYTDIVSTNYFKEKISVNFHGIKYWSADDGQHFLEDESVVQKKIPNQMDPALYGSIEGLSGILANGGKAVVIANFVLNVLLGGALSQLFAAISKLQIMVHLLITNVVIPANAQVFSSGLLSLVTYEIIETEDSLRTTLKLEDDKDFNQNFYALGYHSVFFLINIGNLLFVVCFQFAAYLFILATKRVANQRITAWRNRLETLMMWNFPIEFINETFIILAICCCQQFKYMQYDSPGEVFNSIVATTVFFVLFAAPFIGYKILWKNKDKLHEMDFKAKFKALYENLNFKNNRSASLLMEQCISQLRLLLMSMALIFLDGHPYFQIAINNCLGTSIVIYMKWFEVYREFDYKYFQAFNEAFVLLINYHMICFADFISDNKTRTKMGWSLIVTLAVNLLINFGYIIFTTSADAYRKLRRKYLIRKRDRLREEAEIRRRAKVASQIEEAVSHIDDELRTKPRGAAEQDNQLIQDDYWSELRQPGQMVRQSLPSLKQNLHKPALMLIEDQDESQEVIRPLPAFKNKDSGVQRPEKPEFLLEDRPEFWPTIRVKTRGDPLLRPSKIAVQVPAQDDTSKELIDFLNQGLFNIKTAYSQTKLATRENSPRTHLQTNIGTRNGSAENTPRAETTEAQPAKKGPDEWVCSSLNENVVRATPSFEGTFPNDSFNNTQDVRAANQSQAAPPLGIMQTMFDKLWDNDS